MNSVFQQLFYRAHNHVVVYNPDFQWFRDYGWISYRRFADEEGRFFIFRPEPDQEWVQRLWQVVVDAKDLRE